jgi:hypothetical protein
MPKGAKEPVKKVLLVLLFSMSILNPLVRLSPEGVNPETKSSQVQEEELMKYICLGYLSESLWNNMSEGEQHTFVNDCLSYDDVLRKNGHFVSGEALQGVRTATTIRYRKGKVVVTDGPFAETKEQLGGIMVLEARDLNQAIQLMSQHPSVRMGGTWEVRPANEQINALYQSESTDR